MNRAERVLAWLLRINGVILLTALPATFFPFSWMRQIHRYLGLGSLPQIPIVEYLTRSISFLYALLGVACLVLASDLKRYGPLVSLAGFSFLVFGAVMLSIDYHAAMPPMWTSIEGPLLIALGVAVLWLQRSARPRV